MFIEYKGKPKSEVLVKIGKGYVVVVYDRKGCLRIIREAAGGQIPLRKPKADETVLRVSNFENGEATFKSSGSHCGYYSANGMVYWSSIWEDAGPALYKKCDFHDWLLECARILAGDKSEMSLE